MAAINPKERPLRPRRRILLAMELGGFTTERRAGIAEYARDAGWVLESRLNAFLFQGQHREYLDSMHIDGVISMVHQSQTELFQLLSSIKAPIVDLWRDFPDWPVPRILLDHEAAGRLAAEHLMERGLRNLLFYTHSVDRRAAKFRCDGFRRAAEARGIKIEELWWDSHMPLPPDQGRVGWLANQLMTFPRPLGVMAINDIVAADVLDAAEHAGLRVPEDIAVIGADNDPILTELGDIPLTSVDVARERLGYEAAALLDRMIDGEPPPTDPVLIQPAGVVLRRSTEVLAVTDADVVKAVRFIQSHFREPISVADAAAETFVSRRRLQDRFRAALGHGISEEITRNRVQFAQHLLTQTRHRIGSVATMAGFTSVHHMSKVFRRELGTSPQSYRQRYQMTLPLKRDGIG